MHLSPFPMPAGEIHCGHRGRHHVADLEANPGADPEPAITLVAGDGAPRRRRVPSPSAALMVAIPAHLAARRGADEALACGDGGRAELYLELERWRARLVHRLMLMASQG